MYETRDMYLVAALMTEGYAIRDRFKKRHEAYFKFDDTPELQETVKRFTNHDLYVDAKTYSMNVKSVKDAVYATID